MKTYKHVWMLAIACAAILNPHAGWASGVWFATVSFVHDDHPDSSSEFVAGRLGILQPDYSRRDLFAAYRHLSGIGLDPEEQEALYPPRKPQDDIKYWIREWFDKRALIPGVDPSPPGAYWENAYHYNEKWELKSTDTFLMYTPYRSQLPNFYYFENCMADAFRTASKTLSARIKKYRASNPNLKDWVQAQDLVFANCNAFDAIPPPCEEDQDPLMRADRAYQIAAANFYAMRFAEARKLFWGIASDSTSPWRHIAPYMAARSLIRQATLGAPENAFDTVALRQAGKIMTSILQDKNSMTLHKDARKLLNFIRFRLEPEARFRELARAIVQKKSGGTLRQNMIDYLRFLDKNRSAEFNDLVQYSPLVENPSLDGVRVKAVPEILFRDDVTAWILAVESPERMLVNARWVGQWPYRGMFSLDYSLKKLKETASLPWLVAVLLKIPFDHPQISRILSKAEKIDTASQAFSTVVYHRVRLLMELGRSDEARGILDSILALGDTPFPVSTVNLFKEQRVELSKSLDEFIKFGQRTPVTLGSADIYEGYSASGGYTGREHFFDRDGIYVLSYKMPLDLLKQALTHPSMPAHIRREISFSVWVRAVILGQDTIAQELTPLVEEYIPEATPYLEAYRAAATSESRRFAAVYLLMKYPGVASLRFWGLGRLAPLDGARRLDVTRYGWWSLLHYRRFQELDDSSVLDMAFITQEQKRRAKEEQIVLAAAGRPADFVCQIVNDWVKKHPTDPRNPHALHLAIKATRDETGSKETGHLSRTAFQLLHRKYPNSSWAQKTKYWYTPPNTNAGE